tara:strand:- start:66 stop:332 length:267 start_codon:yes stop_codon:yes gene_type:complete
MNNNNNNKQPGIGISYNIIDLDIDKEYVPMINDIVRMSVIQIVAQVLFYLISPDKVSLISIAFLKTLVFICMGISVYWLLVRKIIIFV